MSKNVPATRKWVDPRNVRTRPKKGEGTLTKPMQIMIDPSVDEVIAGIAASRGITKSEWVRRAINAGIVKHNSRKAGK